MNDIFVQILIIAVLIVLNGIFAMSEIAMVSARKIRLQQRADDGDDSAAVALEMAESPNRLLSTVQVGISLVGVFSGAVGGATLAEYLAPQIARIAVLAPYSEALSLVIVVLIITYFSLVIGELIPKRLAMGNPEKIAITVARPMRTLSALTAPIVNLLSASTELGLRLLRAKPNQEPPITEEEIKVLIEQGTQSGIFIEQEQDIVESVFRLADRRVDAIMTPYTEIEWLDINDSFEENLSLLLENRFTRWPVARGGLDNVIGILNARDLLAATLQEDPVEIEPLLLPALFVPESMPALKAFEEIKANPANVALVIDEFGGLIGMVTLLDILKAIVGEIPKAGEKEDPQIVQRADGSWLLDGLLQVDELKELLDIEDLPDEDRVGYQTVGGMVMAQFGSIPAAGDVFRWQEYKFEVVDMDGRRVDKVLVTLISDEENGKTVAGTD
ncbi:MAG: HlyC/CorC family transporter [Chloroflexi bacterium]|nr:HlyC/CorC family transporter [Chloroflexota bacterium]